jgi:formylmethanofuran dehydrogenase subunit C
VVVIKKVPDVVIEKNIARIFKHRESPKNSISVRESAGLYGDLRRAKQRGREMTAAIAVIQGTVQIYRAGREMQGNRKKVSGHAEAI